MSIRTPLSRVRGLGAAKRGVAHFWTQRVSAIALVPLTIWFLVSVIAFTGTDYDAVTTYMHRPSVTVLFLLFLTTGFYHMRLGLQVVIEDYIAREGTKIALLMLVNFYTVAVGALALYSVLKIALQQP